MKERDDHDDGKDENADGFEAGTAYGVEILVSAFNKTVKGKFGVRVMGHEEIYVVVVQTMAVLRKSSAAAG